MGKNAPKVISDQMLDTVKPGTVMVDISIDQGGCFETSSPTTHDNPTFIHKGIVHYCVTNMPGAVPKTSTVSLTNSTSSYILDLLKEDFSKEIENKPIAKGINIFRGDITHKGLADSFGMNYKNLNSYLAT